jgi:hypothetical protein
MRSSAGLDKRGGWSGDASRRTTTAARLSPVPGSDHDRHTRPHPVAHRGRPRRRHRHRPTPIGDQRQRTLTRELVDLAAATATLLETALPAVDDDEPGTGEAFERAAELGDDARRHLVTAFHLIAGVHGIVSVRPPTT